MSRSSTTIDERVVEMRFDNSKFESAAKKTLDTLTKLKEKLDFTKHTESAKTLNRAVNNMDLSHISQAVDSLNKRFSTMGIVGMTAVQNITNSMIGLVKRGINYVKDAVISGGIRRAMNLENAHFQLQALLKDEEKVQAVMNDANKAVDGTAYALDEAAKAASQFAASGIEAGEDMQRALRGIVGVSAMTNSSFESISQIFTTVAGNGRLMGDQLLQLSSRGLNAASTIADFVNGVNDGSKEATDSVRQMVKEISGGMKLSEMDIRDFVSKGKINFQLFSEAMTEAFADSAERANETFTGSLANLRSAFARIGAGVISPLVAQNSQVVKLFNVLREQVNKVKTALVFDEEIGNTEALTKQISDGILSVTKKLKKFVKALDVESGMQLFYYNVEIIKNVFKVLGSILGPVAKAFSDVFLSFKIDSVISLASKLEEITGRMILSERASQGLHDAFEGVFNVIKLVVDIFAALFGAVIPINEPIHSLAEMIAILAGYFGRLLTGLTNTIRSIPLVSRVFGVFTKAVKITFEAVAYLIDHFDDLIDTIYNMPIVQETIHAVSDAFTELGRIAAPYLDKAAKKLTAFKDEAKRIIPEKAKELLSAFIDQMEKLYDTLNKIDLTFLREGFKKFTDGVQTFLDTLTSSKGFTVFVQKTNEFVRSLKENFTFDRIMDNLTNLRERIGSFVDWFIDRVVPIFENFSFGGAVASGGGLGLIYAIIKVAKAFERVSKSIVTIPELFGELKNTLQAYQKDLQASTLLKVAGAIAILAGAIFLLSFTDPNAVMGIGVMLAALASALLYGIYKIKEATNQAKPVEEGIYNLSNGLNKAVKQLAKAVKIKMIGKAVKDFATSILLVTGSILAIAYAYNKDAASVESALKIVGGIAGIMVGIMIVMTGLAQKMPSGTTNFAKAATSILFLSLSLSIAISALKKLFKIDLPSDWGKKLAILTGIFVGLGILALAIGAGSGLAGTGSMKKGPILAFTAMLWVTVQSLKSLFEMDLPSDWGKKYAILMGIFVAIGALSLVMAASSSTAGGAIKAGGTILALSVFIAVVVAALMILNLVPAKGLMKGALALGTVLTTLAVTLWGAGKITEKTTYKSILAMAIMVGALTASLAVLSMISWQNMLKSGVALGSMLIALALDFYTVSKVTKKNNWKAILTMVVAITTIAASLYLLSEQSWEGVLASGIAMSAVIAALGGAFFIISKSKIDLKALATFMLGCVGLIGIATVLYLLADRPWENVLASAAAMTLLLGGLSGAMIVAKIAGMGAAVALKGMALMALFVAGFTGVLVALGAIFKNKEANELLEGGIDKLNQIANAIGSFFGNIVDGLLDSMTQSLPDIGERLSQFAENAKPFFDIMGSIDTDSLNGFKSIASGLIDMTKGNMWESVNKFFGGDDSLDVFKEKMPKLGETLVEFSDSVSGIDNESIASASKAFKSISTLIDALPKTGGWAQSILGEQNLEVFGQRLAVFGPYLAAFSRSVMGIRQFSIRGAVNAGTAIAELVEALPKTGGWAQSILGEQNLSLFGERLAEFGESLNNYSQSITGLDTYTINSASNAIKILMDAVSSIPNSGGFAQLFTGDKSLSKFGEQLVSFGESLAEFYETLSEVTAGKFTTIVKEIKDGIENLDTTKTMDGSGLASFAKNMKEVATAGVDSYLFAFQNDQKIKKIITEMIDLILNIFDKRNPDFKKAGDVNLDKYLEGFRNKKTTVENAINDVVKTIVEALKSADQKFEKAGENVGIGFVNGLKAQMMAAAKAGSELGTAAYNAAKKSLDEHSPSKKMGEVGYNAGIGFINQLMLFVKIASDYGKQIGEASANGLSFGLSSMDQLLSSSMNLDPVIRPVMDLSNIRMQAADISRMFNASIGVTVDQVNGINASFERNRNRQNNDVVNAIQGLRKDISNMERDSYTIGSVNYEEGSDVGGAIKSLIRATRIQGRV